MGISQDDLTFDDFLTEVSAYFNAIDAMAESF